MNYSKVKKSNVSYFKAFRNKCFMHNNGKENLGKFNARSDEGFFVDYPLLVKHTMYTTNVPRSLRKLFMLL